MLAKINNFSVFDRETTKVWFFPQKPAKLPIYKGGQV
jgi:hypothetical protein